MTILSFPLTITNCGECPKKVFTLDGYFCDVHRKNDRGGARKICEQNKYALTATGPYACPMLKEKK